MSRIIRIAGVGALVLFAVGWGVRRLAPFAGPAAAAVHRLGPIGPVVFVGVYAVAVVALVPASWLTLAGGAMFGIVPAAVYAVVGATLGSTTAFLLGRHGARRIVADHLDAMPRFAAIDRAVALDGRRIVFLLRLSPISPFNFLNYALGLTKISVWDFMAGSLGMIPGAVVYAYAGHFAGEAVALAGQARAPDSASYYLLLGTGLLATGAAFVTATRAARQALRDV